MTKNSNQYTQQSIPVLQSPAIEKRVDHRHTLSLDTEVHFVEQDVEGMFRCRTRNIGLNGAFIPSSAIPVESRMYVEVVLKSRAKRLKLDKNHRQYRLQAQVIHTSEEGAGLVFKMLDHEQQQDFRRFLFKAKVAARN